MNKIIITLIIALFSVSNVFAIEKAGRIGDREIIESLTELKVGLKALNQRIDDMNNRIDALQTLMLWGFGVLFGGMGILIGFVIWDRRTAISPIAREVRELQYREDKLEMALRELANKDPNVREQAFLERLFWEFS